MVEHSLLKKMYYLVCKIRFFEEKIIELYPLQQMRCPVHLYIGQEAIAAGICAQLQKEDYVFSTHRNHGHMIAKGADLKPMFAEIFGKRTGCSGGKGGSTHMVSVENSIMGTSAIVAGGLPIGVGVGLAIQMQKEEHVVVIFFGDGAVDEGTFYESLNYASLKKLPVIFVCENNLYATNSHQSVRQVNMDIFEIAKFFKMPGCVIDGNDIFSVYEAGCLAIERARQAQGPSFIEMHTYRFRTHVGPETDIEKGFRDTREVESWMEKCPYRRLREHVLQNNLLTQKDIDELEYKVREEVQAAADFAMESPFPTEEDFWKDVY